MQKTEAFLAAIILIVIIVVIMVWAAPGKASGRIAFRKLACGLRNACLKYYTGEDDGGLAHITYWTLARGTPAYEALDPREQAKVDKIQANQLHSRRFQPDQIIPGYEATGLLHRGRRRQNITLKLPDDWNGNLVVCGTPALRNEYACEAVFVPWLLAQGYAVISGDKGVPNGIMDLLSGNHPSRYWGIMMLDMALLARRNIARATGRRAGRVYAAGLSNGGYQVRRALEIDHDRHRWGRRLIFDGGLDWSGTFFANARMLDRDGDGRVSVEAYARANTLVSASDRAVLAMGWVHGPGTLTTPDAFAMDPPFAPAHEAMTAAGYTPESAVIWGYYNFDGKSGNEGVAERLTPLQAYVQRAFTYLVDWVENGIPAPDSTVIATDPVSDGVDPEELSW